MNFGLDTALLIISLSPLSAQVNVTTANYDNSRTNATTHETILTPGTVVSGRFGKLFAMPVDGEISAQPLYVQNVAIPSNGTHNVVFVATQHDSVYAFDADAPADPLWQVSLGAAVPSLKYAFSDVIPEVGILSTPVIDPATNTIYVVADSKDSTGYAYRLHALDITTGQEKLGGPTVIQASTAGTGDGSVKGTLAFDPFMHLQRPGLLLLNGVVYIAFGSHADSGSFHGWLFGYNAANVQQQVRLFVSTPNGEGGSIWQGGRGLAADDKGFLYAATGNGDFDSFSNWSESVLKFNTSAALNLVDWFTPDNWMDLNNGDNDLGSAGPILAPGTNLIVAGSKAGSIFLIDRDNLGHTQNGNGQILQAFTPVGYAIFSMAYWDSSAGSFAYVRAFNDALKAFRRDGGNFATAAASMAPSNNGQPWDGISVSSNGNAAASGVVWDIASAGGDQPTPGVLHAYIATDLAKELWNSDMNPMRDSLGGLSKFAIPTVANGKVYAPTATGELVVYGLYPTTASTTAPVIQVVQNGASGLTGAVAPGEIVAIYGSGLGPATLTGAALDNQGRVASLLAGTRVFFDGNPAPVLYTSAGQVGAIVPYEVAGQTSTVMAVEYLGLPTNVLTLPVAAVSPALFTISGTGTGQGAILNQNETANLPANAAFPGSIVVLYGTGAGQTTPAIQDGALAAVPYPQIAAPVAVTIGGLPAKILYAGSAPGLAGVIQINAVVPFEVSSGPLPVTITIGGVTSLASVTVSVL